MAGEEPLQRVKPAPEAEAAQAIGKDAAEDRRDRPIPRAAWPAALGQRISARLVRAESPAQEAEEAEEAEREQQEQAEAEEVEEAEWER